MTSRVLRGSAFVLPALALAFATGCPEEEPVVRNATLKIEPADVSVFFGESTDVTVTSKGKDGAGNTDAVTVVLSKSATQPAGVAQDAPVAAAIALVAAGPFSTDPLSLAPDEKKGVAKFVVNCTGVGNVTLTASTEAVSKEKTTEIRCRAPNTNINLTAVPFQNCQSLQADGASVCEVIVNATEEKDGVVSRAENLPVTATVTAVSNITTPDAQLSTTGDRRVLSTEEVGGQLLESISLRTGVSTNPGEVPGQVSFFVRSPRFLLEETVAIDVVTGVTTAPISVEIQPFVDQSSLTLSLERNTITVNQDASLTVKAVNANGQPANAGQVTLTLPAGVSASGDGVSLTGNVATVLLDANGEKVVTIPTTEVGVFRIAASFLAISGVEPKTQTIELTTTPAGQVNANAILDRDTIVSDANREPKIAVLTLEATRDGLPFNTVTASVRVSLESRATIKLQSPSAGGVLAGEDAATFSSFTDGTASVEIVADSVDSKGAGIITVEILDGTTILKSQDIQVSVDREPRLQSIVFDSFTPTSGVIGVQGSVISSTAVVSFKLFDDEVQPVSGAAVRYEFASSDPGVVVDGDAASGADGSVNVFVNAGEVAAPITVTAIATFNGITARATSPAIAVVGGLPNSETSFVVCDAKAQFDPFTTPCTVTLADRFTNVAENATNVQFRAEGGNITPAVGATDGEATAQFSFGDPGPGSADVLQWSYSGVRNLPTTQRARFAGCFDGTISTDCDLIAICTDADPIVRALCPLPPTLDGAALCTSDLSVESRGVFDDQATDPVGYEIEALTGLDTFAGADVVADVATYQAEHRACGFPLSCLQAQPAGLAFDDADNCPVNLGCLDFSAATECPQDGLLDILASVSGEEGFVDVNGNGIFDDGEDFVDFPEPFLDKNSSCSYDELSNHPRLTPAQAVRLSDLFIDSDASDGKFGIVENGVRTETDGKYNQNTEIFMKTTILHLEGGRFFSFGQRASSINDDDCVGDTTATTSTPVEIATGEAFRPGCLPGGDIRDGDGDAFVFRWADANGNCASVDLADAPSVTATGPIEVAADESVYNEADCGVAPGSIGSHNDARPWCEEHPAMGSRLRNVSYFVNCNGAEGPQLAKLSFSLGDADTVDIAFNVNCPICGDDVIEAEEACEPRVPTSIPTGFTCSTECKLEEATP